MPCVRVEQVMRIYKGSPIPPFLGKKWTVKNGYPSNLAMMCQLVYLEPSTQPKSYNREKLCGNLNISSMMKRDWTHKFDWG